MGRKLLLMNLLMVAGIVLLAQQLVASWSSFQGQPKIINSATEPHSPEFQPLEEHSVPLGEFMVITDQNLFSENRGSEPLVQEDEEEEQPPEFAVAPQLISVSTVRNKQQAVLKISSGRRGRDTENRTVKVSDDVGGYEVAEIGRDFLILRWKDYEEIIELTREASATNTRSRRAAGAVKIITVGAAAAAVETIQSDGAEETERGVQVAAVGNQQQAGGRRGGQGTQGARGGAGTRGNTGARGGRPNNNQNPRAGVPGNLGLGTRRPPVQPTPPPE